MPAIAVPVVEENVRLHDRHRIRWTPVRVEPQRVLPSKLQCVEEIEPSRRFSTAPIACIRASSERSAVHNSFNYRPVRLPNDAQSLLNDLASMIDPLSKRYAKAPRKPFIYQNTTETTRFSNMAIHFEPYSDVDLHVILRHNSSSKLINCLHPREENYEKL